MYWNSFKNYLFSTTGRKMKDGIYKGREIEREREGIGNWKNVGSRSDWKTRKNWERGREREKVREQNYDIPSVWKQLHQMISWKTSCVELYTNIWWLIFYITRDYFSSIFRRAKSHRWNINILAACTLIRTSFQNWQYLIHHDDMHRRT